MTRRARLALCGGPRAVTIPPPHWHWPPADRRENAAVREWLMGGRNGRTGMAEVIERLETEFAAFHGVPHALALSSATACLHTAFLAAGVGPGDEVLAPTVTFPATITPALHCGAVPVLCDCLAVNGTIDPDDAARRVTRRTKAIVVTHLWGHPCRMREIVALARRHQLVLIEDCSHAHGSTLHGRLVGTYGDLAIFSFDNQKMLAAGEGGILLCRTRTRFERAVLASDLGPRATTQVRGRRWRPYRPTGLGLKYRIHPLGAVIAYEKFKRLAELNTARNATLAYFSAQLRRTRAVVPPVIAHGVYMGAHYGYKPSFNQAALPQVTRAELVRALQAEGVDVRTPATPPLHRTELFRAPRAAAELIPAMRANPWRAYPRYHRADFPQAEAYDQGQLSFPTFTFDRDRKLVNQYVAAIRKVEELLDRGEQR